MKGTISFGTELDMSAMLTGPALDAFVDEFRKVRNDSIDDVTASIRRSLPAGVTLMGIAVEIDGAVVTSTATFAFDDIHKLRAVDVFFARGQPSVQPFASLDVLRDEIRCAPPSVPAGAPGVFLFAVDVGRSAIETDGVVDGTRVSWRLSPGSSRFFVRFAL